MNCSLYPRIGIDPLGAHCRYRFSLNAPLVSYAETSQQQVQEPGIRAKSFEKFLSDSLVKFPSRDRFFQDISSDFCRDFSPEKVEVLVSPLKEDFEIGIGLSLQYTVPPPVLSLVFDGTHLSSTLSNAQTSYLAIPLWAYGLSALQTIYSAYGVERSFLPRIEFGRNKLRFKVPFLTYTLFPPEEERIAFCAREMLSSSGNFYRKVPLYGGFSFCGANIQIVPLISKNADFQFIGEIDFKPREKNLSRKNDLAASLLSFTLFQARTSYEVRQFR